MVSIERPRDLIVRGSHNSLFEREATVVAFVVHWRRAQVLILSLNSSRLAATSTDILDGRQFRQNDFTIPAGATSPKPSRQGVDDVGLAHAITPVLVTGQSPPAGGPSSIEGCVRQARGADMRVAERGRQAGSGSQAALGDAVVRWCGGAAAMHAVVQTADRRHPRNFHPTTLVVRAFRFRPLRQAEGHVHDCAIAHCAHREAASLEHIQHRGVFREDLGGELTKSGLTAEGCEMAHQC